MSKSLLAALWLLLVFVFSGSNIFAQTSTNGALEAVSEDGKILGACPLKQTNVKAEISGFLARVRVRQEFENNFTDKIEAVYVFPLSQTAAVDEMTMQIGERTVRGKIMKRAEARAVYDAAKSQGHAAALLDEERPNVFTQSVANILPGEKITVEISYVETLKYDEGSYEFVFPTVVAPRYNPAQVKDASAVSPPVAETRAGHDISIEVNLDAGVPVENIAAKTHEIETTMFSPSRAVVRLKNEKDIPNRDFVLRYDVAGKKVADAVLTHRDERSGFFTLILQPPDRVSFEDVMPKEIVFVLDTSGSMSGFPIEKAKEAMKRALDGLHPFDTFNLITFAGDTHILFENPVPATAQNLRRAQELLDGAQSGGGTEMMKAIKAALQPSGSKQHVRVVCFMTDGMVGNEEEIIAEVKAHKNARVFAFGIGESVNRYLLDKISQEGRGEAEYVSLTDDGSAAARRFHERVRSPLLTDVSVDWNGLPVADVYPNKIPDLFSAKPVVIHGRFTKAGQGAIRLKGKSFGQDFAREITINFPENQPQHDALAKLWARTRIDDLTSQNLTHGQTAAAKIARQNDITRLALEYGLLTQFTSFVAVEERVATDGGEPRRVEVPVETPAGTKKVYREWSDKDVAYITTEDERTAFQNMQVVNSLQRPPVVAQSAPTGNGGGRGKTTGSASLAPDIERVIKPSFELKQQATLEGAPQTPSISRGIGSGRGSGVGAGSGNIGNAVNATEPVPPPVGNVQAVVEITAETVQVDATDTKIQTNVSAKSIQNLPVNGRRSSSLLKLSPGTRAEPLAGQFQIDGTSGGENSFVIDGVEVTNFRTGILNKSSKNRTRNVVSGKVLEVPVPEVSENVRWRGKAATVAVKISVDENGNVSSANAILRIPQLRAAAVLAARQIKFAPTNANGLPIRLNGTVIYRFARGEETKIWLANMKAQPLTAAGRARFALEAKAHPKILALAETFGKKSVLETFDFVGDGKAEIFVRLADLKPQTIAALKTAGFEIERELPNFKTVAGRIRLEKLAAVANLKSVVYLAPNAKN
jgi:Ca-activated chloride channel homolog